MGHLQAYCWSMTGRIQVACLLIVVVWGAAWLVTDISRHPVWTNDGFFYLHVTAMDAGRSPDEATREAESFYETIPSAHDSRYASFYRLSTADVIEQGKNLGGRPLYPVLAALFYRVVGPDALLIVSGVSYILAIVACYWLAVQFVPPICAAASAMLFASLPIVRYLGSAALTDMLSLALWALALSSLIAYLHGRRLSMLAMFALAAVLLAFTRPAIYLPAAAAAGSCYSLWRRPGGLRRSEALAFVTIIILLMGIAFVGVSVFHAPGIHDELANDQSRDEQLGAPHQAFTVWYIRSVLDDAKNQIGLVVFDIWSVSFVVAAAFGFAARRPVGTAALVLGASSATVAILVNPVRWALERTVEVPVIPMLIVGTALAAYVLANLARRLPVTVSGSDAGRRR